MINDFIVLCTGFLGGLLGGGIGGSGLLIIPSLLFIGIPTTSAIATTKVGVLGVVFAGLFIFRKEHKSINMPSFLSIIGSIIGAYFGANLLFLLPQYILIKSIGIIMLIIVYMMYKNIHLNEPNLFLHMHKLNIVNLFIFFSIGFFGALFGGGFALLSIFVFVVVFGKSFLQSLFYTHVLGIGVACIAILIFYIMGAIHIQYAILLFISMFLGTLISMHFEIHKSNIFIKKLYLLIVFFTAIRLLI